MEIRGRKTLLRFFLVAATALLVAGVAACTRGPRPPHNGTNVLLIVMDTVRADRLGCYGNDRQITPTVDALAGRGYRFENFYSNASWTLPAHASLFTGVYSVAHRATQETLALDDRFPTLAEILGAAGYQTFGSSTNAIVSSESGLARGFETFVPAFRPSIRRKLAAPGSGASDVNNLAFERFLTTARRDRPFFAFINYIDAHAPYDPPRAIRDRFVDGKFGGGEIEAASGLRMPDHYMYGRIGERQFELLSQLYDGEVNNVDLAIDNLLSALEADGRLDSTLVIITSDHGENLGDHGHFAHVFSIHNTLLRVPLIVVPPEGLANGVVRRETAQLLDLFPTILAWCGVEYSGRRDGRDLFAKGAEDVVANAFSEYYYPRQVLSAFDPDELVANIERFQPFMKRQRALQNRDYKLTWGSDGTRELYHIGEDPRETRNLVAADSTNAVGLKMAAELEGMVAEYQGEPPLDPPPPIGWLGPGFEEQIKDPELLRKLRSLGYVR